MTRQSWGGVVMAPSMRTMFGWRYLASMLTSLLNSPSSSSLIFGLKTFLIATSTSKHFPLWMVLNPPIEISSPIYRSLILNTSTPPTASRSASTSTASTLFALLPPNPVLVPVCGLKIFESQAILGYSFSTFFSSISQLGVSVFPFPPLDLDPFCPSKHRESTSCRLSANLRVRSASNLLARGFPRSARVDSFGNCIISQGRSLSALFSRFSTFSLKSSAMAGSMLAILLSERQSSSSDRMPKTSLGMKESSRLERLRSFLLDRLA